MCIQSLSLVSLVEFNTKNNLEKITEVYLKEEEELITEFVDQKDLIQQSHNP